jgi:hypothetical protein
MYRGTICRETPHTVGIYSKGDYTSLTIQMPPETYIALGPYV